MQFSHPPWVMPSQFPSSYPSLPASLSSFILAMTSHFTEYASWPV